MQPLHEIDPLPDVTRLETERASQLAQERRNRGRWYWLSFATDYEFLGACVVWAHGMETAVLHARNLKISSGFRGEVEIFCEPLPRSVMQKVPADLRNRLLSERVMRKRLRCK